MICPHLSLAHRELLPFCLWTVHPFVPILCSLFDNCNSPYKLFLLSVPEQNGGCCSVGMGMRRGGRGELPQSAKLNGLLFGAANENHWHI